MKKEHAPVDISCNTITMVTADAAIKDMQLQNPHLSLSINLEEMDKDMLLLDNGANTAVITPTCNTS